MPRTDTTPSVITTLVVDDQPDIRALLRAVLEQADDEITVTCEASNGIEAVERIAACDPTVVVIDYSMPGMDGIETSRHIRRARPDQPIVLCSAHLDEVLTRRALSEGIQVCISKDEVMVLPDAIRKALV